MRNPDPFGGVVLMLAGLFFIYRTYSGFTEGYITGKYGAVYHRDDSPIGYWFGMLVSLAAAIGFPIAAIMNFF
mgnify:CR=1 FL=1